ncbi:transglycosylase family protein [Streptomyces sp. NPDC020996]|uniref:transglycosylase family protein n=1 Tax=Streptomyces sp. NPDC020996 TaxID=3154791 RepID=UPI0033EC5E3B
MLSGNGRHRRPRQAPALLVAAGVTGSAIAIPLLGASAASAADGSTWDKVAECETGGSWSENSGDGFYGGLRLSQEDWEKYGGLDYAPSADLASRNQQIAVAEKILADQGAGAFHTCGLTAGLDKDKGAADIDTGIADDSSDSTGVTDSTGLSNGSSGASGDASGDTSGTASPSDAPSHASASPGASKGSSSTTDKPAKSDKSASPSASPSVSRTSDGSPDETAESDDTDNSEQMVGSWSLVDTGSLDVGSGVGGDTGTGRHRGGSADEAANGRSMEASSGRHAARTDADDGDAYTVHAGDTLASVADTLDVEGGWRELYALNKKAIGADPSHIVPGQTLRVGAETGEN